MTADCTTAPADVSVRARESRGTRAPVGALAFGITFLVGSEFLPASVLPAMAADLGVREGVAGLAVATTALAGAVTAPTIAAVLPRTDRRVVLIGLLILAVVSNLMVAAAPNFAVLLAGRLVLGIAIAGYWSFAFGVGVAASPGRDHVVSTSLSVGVSVATIVGVPVASLVGDAVGWRASFLGAAGLGLLAVAAVALTLPAVPAHPAAGLTMMRRALSNRRLLAGVACIVLLVFGNFAAYPYIRLAIGEVDSARVAPLLLLWGLGGLAGNFVAGSMSRRLQVGVVGAALLLAVGLVLTAEASTVPVLVIGVVVWGVGFNMTPILTQLWVIRVEPDNAESAMSLQVMAFQMAITLGAIVGGAVVDGSGVQLALLVGGVAAAASALGLALLGGPRR